MKALIGQKIGMSQLFSSTGEVVPVTIIEARPNQVTLLRSNEKDGYQAVQLGLPKIKEKPKHKYISQREFAGQIAEGTEQITVSQFEKGDIVEVSGVSKGKGFQGVVKRHGFAGGPASHGHRHVLRSPGSIGSRFPQHVLKGRRMAGRMGGEKVTVKNLIVADVDVEKNLIAIKGAIPGKSGSIVTITATYDNEK